MPPPTDPSNVCWRNVRPLCRAKMAQPSCWCMCWPKPTQVMRFTMLSWGGGFVGSSTGPEPDLRHTSYSALYFACARLSPELRRQKQPPAWHWMWPALLLSLMPMLSWLSARWLPRLFHKGHVWRDHGWLDYQVHFPPRVSVCQSNSGCEDLATALCSCRPPADHVARPSNCRIFPASQSISPAPHWESEPPSTTCAQTCTQDARKLLGPTRSKPSKPEVASQLQRPKGMEWLYPWVGMPARGLLCTFQDRGLPPHPFYYGLSDPWLRVCQT